MYRKADEGFNKEEILKIDIKNKERLREGAEMKMTDTGDTGKIGYFYRSYPCRPYSGTTPFYFPGSI